MIVEVTDDVTAGKVRTAELAPKDLETVMYDHSNGVQDGVRYDVVDGGLKGRAFAHVIDIRKTIYRSRGGCRLDGREAGC